MKGRKKHILILFIYKCLGLNRNKYIRNHKIFANFGENSLYHPTMLPSYPELISIGNNVIISANVFFYEHDIIHFMFNNDKNYKGPKLIEYRGKINIKDNCVVGGGG